LPKAQTPDGFCQPQRWQPHRQYDN
jgi:hypothetical protein